MDDDRTAMLIRRNRALVVLAASARADAHKAVARAEDHIVMIREAQRAMAHALSRLQNPRADSPSADALFRC